MLDNDLNQKAVYDHVGAPWGVCISQGRTSISTAPTRSRPATTSTQAPTTGEIYKMQLDGTVLGRFGKAGKALKEFAASIRWTAGTRTKSTSPRSPRWRVQKIILRPQAADVRRRN